ncbi:MAG: lipid A export permease/ATP-binding protein MsbA [Gammaproteobacteria bacterium]|nr:lipid A export permease/ATP-binding protein MsbA [Gammaproteobacteria bacterium]
MKQKKSTDLELYLRLLTYVKPYLRIFLVAVFALAVLALTSPAIAALFKNITEGVFQLSEINLVTHVIVPIILVFLVAAVASYISRYALAWVADRLVMDLRMEMFNRLLSVPCAGLDRHSAGSLISRFTFDAAQLKEAATNVITTLSRDTLSIIGLAAWMAWIDWALTLVAFLAGPVILSVLLLLRRRLRRISRLVQDSMADLHNALGEAIAAHRIIRIFAGQEQESERVGQKANANRQANMKFVAASAAGTPAINVITALALGLIVYVAAQHAATDRITVAEFNSFFAALLMLLSPLRRLARINEDLQRGLTACESVFAFIDQEAEADAGKVSVSRLTGQIEIRNLSFAYGTADEPVLQDVSLNAQPGQLIAIVGPSGSGKTSLVDLVARFYDAQGGEMRVDGHDIRDLSLACLRENIALVSQDVVLYNDTVFNNIAYGGNRGAGMERVREAARLADALTFIEDLENGFDTVIGNNGSRLSGGQRQRIALARALLKDAPILVLDEATAALDTESERRIQQSLASIRQDRTCIIIAHRLTTIENADQILVMDNGRLVETGTHDQLIARNGVYSRLYAGEKDVSDQDRKAD